MIAADLIAQGAKEIYEETPKCGYIWGTYGGTWTEKDQAAVNNGTKKTGDADQTEKTKAYGSKWIGHRVFDCSGLWYYLMKKNGGYVYHGSDTMWHKYCTDQGRIFTGKKENGEELKPGTAVFLYKESTGKRHHVGIYIGGGKCIEAKGTYYGVVQSDISHWDEWGEIKGVWYGEGEPPKTLPTLRRGSEGEDVRTLQTMLNLLGYNCGEVDGVYGRKTEAAVKAFQKTEKITVDGICGEETWKTLNVMDTVHMAVKAFDITDTYGDSVKIVFAKDAAKAFAYELLDWANS